jgi:sugar-specific transcriptional regulator TrmB
MYTEETFIARLIGFGLSEKEARLYFHLLKYGPKSTAPLTKSLKTYREDVHRTLSALIEKGMVHPSFGVPTFYVAVELEKALESVLKKQESELREMEERKRELADLSTHQRFSPSNDVNTFKIIKSLGELVSVTIPLINSAQEELLFIVPQDIVTVASRFGVAEEARKFIERGGNARGITDVSHSGIELMQEMLDISEEFRHFDQYHGITFCVVDRKTCLTAINIDLRRLSLHERVAVLWSDDPIYGEYLSATFDVLWGQSVPAAQRIKELQQRPVQFEEQSL